MKKSLINQWKFLGLMRSNRKTVATLAQATGQTEGQVLDLLDNREYCGTPSRLFVEETGNSIPNLSLHRF